MFYCQFYKIGVDVVVVFGNNIFSSISLRAIVLAAMRLTFVLDLHVYLLYSVFS